MIRESILRSLTLANSQRLAFPFRWIASNLPLLMTLVFTTSFVRPAFTDGLIYQLPPDGTTVEFQGDYKAKMNVVVPKEIEEKLSPEVKAQLTQDLKMRAIVNVSSVGQVTRAGQKCRWIELRMGIEAMKKESEKTEPRLTDSILKMLIPEKFLARDADPLDQAILTLFDPKDIDKQNSSIETGFNRIQYEIDRFSSVFPKPLNNIRQLPKKTIKTPVGTFTNCEWIEGETEFDRPLLGQGRWAFKNKWKIALHPDAPFGVVEIQCHSVGQEINATNTTHVSVNYTLTLMKVGKNAISALDEAGDNGKSEE